ncbi:hypothetical protein LAP9571_02902 [Lactiplantibacillus plantarum]|nr:hypothetical protein LAP9571_02902 [Lactiplantibacillus plantarum]VFI63942.1 hypothetical protein LAP9492_02949 [Lactiplantibacillus plantarum]
MKRQTFNKIIKTLAILVVLAIMVIFIGHNYINTIEKRREIVQIPKDTKQTLFFYRDDCSDCQSIFHQIYWHNAINHNIVLINMNQPQNRHYIQKYQLTSVPTLIHGKQRYSGTNQQRIKQIVGD